MPDAPLLHCNPDVQWCLNRPFDLVRVQSAQLPPWASIGFNRTIGNQDTQRGTPPGSGFSASGSVLPEAVKKISVDSRRAVDPHAYEELMHDLTAISSPRKFAAGVPKVDANLYRKLDQFINKRITYNTDMELFSQNDYWQRPIETADLGKGDCEDIALLKLSMLADLGGAKQNLFLVIGIVDFSSSHPQSHAVAVVRDHSSLFILDNLYQNNDPAPVSLPRYVRKHDFRLVAAIDMNGVPYQIFPSQPKPSSTISTPSSAAPRL